MKAIRVAICGALAGAITGIFGAGGGLVLVPTLQKFAKLHSSAAFSSSVFIMLPICLVSLFTASVDVPLPWHEAFPYVIGGGLGGWIASFSLRKLPAVWLHKILGLFILWGGIRYLC